MMIKKFFFGLFLFFPVCAFSFEKDIKQIEERYLISVAYEQIQFPNYWHNPRFNVQYKKVRHNDMPLVLNSIKFFLHGYPKKVIVSDLNEINIMGDFSIYGKPFGASYFSKSIYLKYSTLDGDDVRFATRVLHHEFSSILMKKYLFPKKAWERCNSGKYRSKNQGLDMLNVVGDGRDEHHKLLQQGFLTSYGSSDFQNDVNIYAEYIFVESRRLRQHSKKYTSIKCKKKIIEKFYCEINKGFRFCK